MPHQVDDAFRTPCPVPSCPAYEPNAGSFLPKPINKSPIASRGADIVMQSSPVPVLQVSEIPRLPESKITALTDLRSGTGGQPRTPPAAASGRCRPAAETAQRQPPGRRLA